MYKEGVKFAKKTDKDEDRVVYLKNTLDERKKRLIYNNWRLFIQSFKKSKEYWYRIFLKLDKDLVKRAVKKWKAGAQFTV